MGYLPFTFDLSKLHEGEDGGIHRTYGKLICPGIGTFDAFSGDQQYMNKLDCSDIPKKGPIPPGSYYIVYLPAGGGLGTKFWTLVKDDFRTARSLWHSGTFSKNWRYKWFGLYNKNSLYDYTMVNNIKRGNFRLHPVNEDGLGVSDGCVTLRHYNDFMKIRAALFNRVKNKKGIRYVSGPKMLGGKIVVEPGDVDEYTSFVALGEINIIGKANFKNCLYEIK